MKNILHPYLAFIALALLLSCGKEEVKDDEFFAMPPTWADSTIWYQIFVDRFYNGDTTNDPTRESIGIPPIGHMPPEDWQITPWTQDWYTRRGWEASFKGDFGYMHMHRRYGGDLQGVIDKLDYLQSLGVNAIYLNPINHAPSSHKYDASAYHHVDAYFGPDPAGDLAIMAKEDPSNPDSWEWTAADKLFLQLVKELHWRDMRIVMDYSWNHTGTLFWAWQDVLKNQEKSPYKSWYAIKSFDDPKTDSNEFAYQGWLNINSLPELAKVDVTSERINGKPYEGNLNEGAKKHVFAVTKRWLAPDGDTAKGIDGYRLDVADQIGLGFWRDLRKEVRSIKKNTYLVGEIWWETWPDILMDPTPYTTGDMFDAVMFYQVYRPARYYFAETDFPINAKQLADSLSLQYERLRPETRTAMMNVASSHDAPRILSDFYNRHKYKYNATPQADANYKTGKPDEAAVERMMLYLMYAFTIPGGPHIWAGDEMGMWGGDDPHCRKPLIWPEYTFEPETRNNFQPGPSAKDSVQFSTDMFRWYQSLIKLHKNFSALNKGGIDLSNSTENVLDYIRSDGSENIRVMFNMSNTVQTVKLPGKYTVVMGYNTNGSNSLQPLSALIIQF